MLSSIGIAGWHGASLRANYILSVPSHFPPLKKPLIIFLLLIFVPIAASAARYFWLGDGRGNWQTADRSSSGLLPPATSCPDANFFGRVDEHEADKHSDADGHGSAPVVP